MQCSALKTTSKQWLTATQGKDTIALVRNWYLSKMPAHLDLYKLSFALVTDLEEGLARHVLDARMSLMHELKQLVHDGLQELPVVAQKAGILADHIPVARTR